MKLSIVTINYNNAEGLRRTLASVAVQTYDCIEHIIIDGGSTDGSVEIIKEYVRQLKIEDWKFKVDWVSEQDKGIYNAMNKGIRKASGEYIQILNSGDILAASDVTKQMMEALRLKIEDWKFKNKDGVGILYGNMIKKDYRTGKVIGKSGAEDYSLCMYYFGTLNHDCCYIRRDLFETYGLYDESLKIVSDWKWFVQVTGLGKVKPVYVDIDVTIFDCSGVSERNVELRNKERRQVLEEVLSPAILNDFEQYSFPIEQYKRLKKYNMWGLVYFIERVLFKLNKWGVLK